jgi:RNA 2',3'-cyclic 3'-phosphodiesterase
MQTPELAPEPKRLFFALWPSDETRAHVSQAADRLIDERGLTGYKSRPARYHVTLYFLGDQVSAELEAAARKAAAQIQTPPFVMPLDQIGSFNNRAIPVWLGCSVIPPELKHLDNSLRKAFKGLSFERQPRFAPHLTIMRNATKRLPTRLIDPIAMPVKEFVLIHSIITDASVEYRVLARYPLNGHPLPPEPQQGKLF